MAESESSQGGSWWGGWLQAAKDKSVSALEFVKKDLTEFSSTMQTDTTEAANVVASKLNQEGATVATKKVREGVNNLLGGITKALTIEAEDKKPGPPNKKKTTEHVFDKAKARLQAIQLDPGTYCNNPENQEDFNRWREGFSLEAKKGDISELLVANADVRSIYTQMVPSSVSHVDFWCRYFYRIHTLEQDEARRAALKERATNVTEDLELDWDEDDEWEDIDGPSLSPVKLPASAEDRLSGEEMDDNKQSRLHGDEGQDDEAPEILDNIPDTLAKTELNVKNNAPSEGVGDVKDEPKTIEPVQNVKTADVNVDSHNENAREELKTESSPKSDNPSLDASKTSTDEVEEVASQESIPTPAVKDEQKAVATQSDNPSEVKSTITAEPSRGCVKEVTVDQTEETDTSIHDIAADEFPSLKEELEIQVKEKGDLVMIGSDRTTPSSDTSNNKELDEDWEDFDIEVTEEDLKAAQESAKKLANMGITDKDDDDDDWESWD